jgi:glycosyltransferase involved in cell wall biosynthesis
MPIKKLKVCYFGTYRAEYSRNRIMIEALRCSGVDVIVCHEQLWKGIEDRVESVEGGWMKLTFWKRVLRAYLILLRKFRKIGDYDILIVGYPGQFDVLLARFLTWINRKPLVWDIFMSIYLISLERGLEERNRIIVGLLRAWEYFATRLPDLLILDTPEYVSWYQKTHQISAHRFKLVPTGADDRIFSPIYAHQSQDKNFTVIYYGTFIPNHGVIYIIEAIKLLSEYEEIQFDLIGDGPDHSQCIAYATKNVLTNVTFNKWLDKEFLVKRIAQADICLGAFGTTPQSLMTVQNKIYESLAVGKTVITGDSPAMRQSFTHRENVYLCKRADPDAIALAILTLYKDSSLRKKIADSGYATYQQNFSLHRNGERFKSHLICLLQKNT